MVDLARERERLSKELADTEAELDRARQLLKNQSFLSRAPAHVVEKERTKHNDLEARAAQIRERLAMLQ